MGHFQTSALDIVKSASRLTDIVGAVGDVRYMEGYWLKASGAAIRFTPPLENAA